MKKPFNWIVHFSISYFFLSLIFAPVHAYAIPKKKAFLAKLHEKSPAWMEEQIREDFLPFSHGIDLKSIAAMWNHRNRAQLLFVRFKISKNQLQSEISLECIDRALPIEKALQFLIETVGLPDLDLILTVHDSWSGEKEMSGPILSFAKPKEECSAVLIPDCEALNDYTIQFPQNELNSYPWENKEKKAFWRGATTGGIYTKDNWNIIPRGALVLLSTKQSEFLDAKFTTIAQCRSEVYKIFNDLRLLAPHSNLSQHLKYRYLIDVDGNSCTYSRCYWIMLSNSLMLKQVSNNIQWYYKGLIPYQHFIPLKSDMSDTVEKVMWAKTHDKEVKQAAEMASEFAIQSLSVENIYIYFYKVLLEYARLQKS